MGAVVSTGPLTTRCYWRLRYETGCPSPVRMRVCVSVHITCVCSQQASTPAPAGASGTAPMATDNEGSQGEELAVAGNNNDMVCRLVCTGPRVMTWRMFQDAPESPDPSASESRDAPPGEATVPEGEQQGNESEGD